ncbi:12542_t:CDS:10, partial [Cetraspora pellucida]
MQSSYSFPVTTIITIETTKPLLQYLLQRDVLSTVNSIDAESVFDYYVQKMPNYSFQKVYDALGKDLEETLDSQLLNEQITRVLRNIRDNWNIWKTRLQIRNYTKTSTKQKNIREVQFQKTVTKYQKGAAKVTTAEVDKWTNEIVNFNKGTIYNESKEKEEPKWVLRKRKLIKVNKEINEISNSSVAKSNRPTEPDLVIDNNGIEQNRVSNMDYDNFTKAFQELDDNKKWVLRSGKVVEDELYKFGMKCNDKSLIEEKVFTELELMEIRTHKLKSLPDMPQDLLEYLGSYQLSTISDLRMQIFKSESWKISYNRQKDFDKDWIRNTIDNLIREYEVDSLKKEDHLEVWLLSHIWLFVDRAFENIEGVQAIRGESCSLASSSRKNRNRRVASVDSIPRKIMGRRGDLIIRRMSMEYGCGEIGNLYVGYNGTKILRERGLKTPKMMKDQFDDLCVYTKWNEKKIRKLETIGFIHAGILDSPAGYIGRITRSKMLTIPSTISEFGARVLPVIMLSWKAKKIVSNVIEMINQIDDENPLQSLQQSCENIPSLSLYTEVHRPTTFRTPRN